ncbi:hypothetical protein V8C35DRAFT_115937 [Trichoderma chlorosporum]
MAVFRNIAVAGGSGNFGAYVLKALLQANFNVTVLTRSQKPGAYDAKVIVAEVDFTSMGSLNSALQGQDAVVSTVGPAALEGQKVLIDAAVAAGVKRFIPSDFGVCTTSPKVLNLPFYSTLASIRQYLADKVATSTLTYTIVATGAFSEYFVMSPAVADFKNHSVTLMDGGNNRVSTTTLDSAGAAIASIFSNPDKTENRVVYVSGAIVTQKQVLDIAKELKPGITWTISNTKASDILKAGLDEISSGGDPRQAIGKIIVGTAFGGDEYGCAYDNNGSSLLGVEAISQTKLKSLIAERLD